MAAKLVLVFCCALWATTVLGDDTCPFDPPAACNCFMDKSAPDFNYSAITCSSKDLPKLTVKSGERYTVQTLTIWSDAISKLNAGYFNAFKSIQDLELVNSGPSITWQKFDANAFVNVTVDAISFTGIDGLLPPPDSLKTLKSGLKGLSISTHGAAELGDSIFQDFQSLRELAIQNTNITTIDDNALGGIDRSLEVLSMNGVGLTQFPASTLSYLRNLTGLVLSNNHITSLPPSIFKVFPNLMELDLSGNPLAADIQKGSLSALPASLKVLYTRNVGLTSIPTDLLLQNPQLLSLALSNNQIQKVMTPDLVGVPNLETLMLEGNPISSIQRGSFQLLKNSQSIVLSNTNLPSFDFSLLAGMGKHVEVYLDYNAMLTSLELSSNAEIPSDLTVFLRNTSLQTIDPSCQALLDKSMSVTMVVQDNLYLKCASLDWLAKYAVCNRQVDTTGSQCADQKNTSLFDYLKPKVTCPSTTSTTTAPPPTTPSNSTDGTTPNGSVQISSSILMALITPLLIMFVKH